MKRIGITTTVPSEFIFAAGCVPVDLNNIFITGNDPARFVETAELAGFPRTTCGWIKGMYGAAKAGTVDVVIAVSDGDCSHTRSLLEILRGEGMGIIPFAFPYDRDRTMLRRQMDKLGVFLKVRFDEAERWMRRLDVIRRKLWEIDRLTWEENKVTGAENHIYLVSASDFDGSPDKFEEKVDRFLEEVSKREPLPPSIRLAYVGVPPIVEGLYDFLEQHGARVVFNEVQRQFTLPVQDEGLVERYIHYTYPYDVFARMDDIEAELEKRGVDAIIHYSQSFCHHQMEDIMFRKRFAGYPCLTLEGDAPHKLDARTRLRIESFCEMLNGRKGGSPS